MKAVLVDYAGNPITVIPDSAITPNRRPWFVPDFGGDWTGEYYVAVRIGRLGKGIAPRFASRYVDGVAVAVHPRPSAPANDTVCSIMDGALLVGDWMTPDEDGALPVFAVESTEVTPDWPEIADVLGCVSLHATLKTGDIVLLPITGCQVRLTPGIKLTAADKNGVQILSINIK